MKSILTKITPLLLLSSFCFAEKVVVLDKAEKSLAARVDFLSNAKSSIDAQYFTVENDRISVGALALLRQAARNGVTVRILVDSMHNLMTRELMAALLDNLETKAAEKIQIKEFNNFKLLHPLCYSKRMHDKSLIVDKKYLFVGDRNVANGYFNLSDTDPAGVNLPIFEGTDVLIAGEKTVSEAEKYFNDRWDSKDVKPVLLYEFSTSQLDYSYCSYKDDMTCETRRQHNVDLVKKEMKELDEGLDRIKNNFPFVKDDSHLDWLKDAYETNDVSFIHDEVTRVCKGKTENNIGAQLYNTIDENTQKSLIITTPYLVVTPEMEALVKKLIDRDVNVRFITNSIESNDVPSAHSGYLATRNKLFKIKNEKTGNSVKIYEYHNFSKQIDTNTQSEIVSIDTVHAKIVVMDNTKLFVGSYNWDYRSQNLNSEVGVLIGLDGLKKTGPTHEIRDRLAELLQTAKLVRADGSVSDLHTVGTDFTDFEKSQISGLIGSRKSSSETWNQLLKSPFGSLLLEQL